MKAIKIKPVRPTIIRDKGIVRDVIGEIRREPTSAEIADMKKCVQMLGVLRAARK